VQTVTAAVVRLDQTVDAASYSAPEESVPMSAHERRAPQPTGGAFARYATGLHVPGEQMNLSRLNLALVAGGVLSAALVGCGGGGGVGAVGDGSSVATPASVAVTVVDGAIQNATVCLDKNLNGACDADEPSGRTDADGKVTLSVDPADVGKYPVLALVGTDAVDKDNGPVMVPFALKAPADATDVVSPLTTLVQAHVESAGTTTAQAEAAVKEQLGVTGSLLADFTQATDAASVQAATLARLVVVTKQEQVTTTAGATDASGTALSAADIENAVNARLLQLLPSLIQAASDPAVTAAATPAEKEAALLAAAQAIAVEAGLSKDNVATVVATAQPTAGEPAGSSAAGATLRWFTFTNVNNFFYRAFRTSAEGAIADANGKLHFTEYRERKSDASGTLVWDEWGDGASNWLRNQLMWTGSEWFDCPTTFAHEYTAPTALGESESLYCKSYAAKSKRSVRDIAGARLIDIVKEIRAYPLSDTQGKFSAWGPDPADPAVVAALGEQTFPAGSSLSYWTTTPISNPDLYGTTPNDKAMVYSAEIASGDAAACAPVTPANASTFQSEALTLDTLIARTPGIPCSYTPSANTGPTNDSWGMSTVNIGDVAVAPFEVPGINYYKNNVKRIRASFGPNLAVTFHSCLARISDNSARNCSVIGTGSYSIEALGDARVLRFAGVPAAAAPLTYNRVFVERGGQVWYGSRDKLIVTNQLRLNLPAAEALLGALGLN